MKTKQPTLDSSRKKIGITIYVGNLNFKKTEEDIAKMFERYGKVTSVKIIHDAKTKNSKGIAFVEMLNTAEALVAIEKLNGREVDGRTLKVSAAKERFTLAEPIEAVAKEITPNPSPAPRKKTMAKLKPEPKTKTVPKSSFFEWLDKKNKQKK